MTEETPSKLRDEEHISYSPQTTPTALSGDHVDQEDDDAKIDQMFEESGGFGRFQVFSFIAIALGMSSTHWFIYESGFLL